MGIFQKRRYANFLQWVLDVEIDDPKTWQKLDLTKMNMKDVYDHWKCDENTQAFTGHAIGLYQSDDYLDDNKETLNCILRLQLYAKSLSRFEKSPYIYPVWGLGGLPEGFSRLAAVHGGVYMLRRQVKEFIYNNDGSIKGVKVMTDGKDEGEAYCKQIIGDPSYFIEEKRVKKIGQIAKWLCLLDHCVEGTNNSGSAQIILPGKQTGHKCDIYMSVMNWTLQVAPPNRWIAMISANVYTNNPKKELEVAYKLLGKVLKDFFFVTDQYVANNNANNIKHNIFIPSSMDASSHFEEATREVMEIYKDVTGQEVDLNSNPQDITDAQ